MKFFKKSKKGFTLVELIVVIAIVAILAAVSVVSYIAFINKGNESADIQLVKQLNTCLQADEALNGKRIGARADYEDIEHMLEENGFIVENLTKTKSGLDIVYQPDPINRFALLDGEKLVYGESSYNPEDKAVMIWNADTKQEALDYVEAGKGVRLADGVGAIDEVNTSASFYVGNNAVGKINYVNDGAGQTVCFTTNGGDLVVNGKSDTVNHYAYLDNLTIEHVDSASYHEYGTVRVKMTINDGHVVMEENSSVNELIIPETTGTNSVSVDVKTNAAVSTLVVDDEDATVGVESGAEVGQVVGEKENISGAGAKEAKENAVEKTYVSTALQLQRAVAAYKDGEVDYSKAKYIVLQNDIDVGTRLTIERELIIDGTEKKYAISVSNENISNGRAINVWGGSFNTTLKNLKVIGPTDGSYTRGINLGDAISLMLDNVEVSASCYAINIIGRSNDLKLSIYNSKINGWAALNMWGFGHNININNSELIGTNDKGNHSSNTFATICFEADTTFKADDYSFGSIVTISNSLIKAVETNKNIQAIVSYNTGIIGSLNNTLILNNCKCEYERVFLLPGVSNGGNRLFINGEEKSVAHLNTLESLNIISLDNLEIASDKKSATGSYIASINGTEHTIVLSETLSQTWSNHTGKEYHYRFMCGSEMYDLILRIDPTYSEGFGFTYAICGVAL